MVLFLVWPESGVDRPSDQMERDPAGPRGPKSSQRNNGSQNGLANEVSVVELITQLIGNLVRCTTSLSEILSLRVQILETEMEMKSFTKESQWNCESLTTSSISDYSYESC